VINTLAMAASYDPDPTQFLGIRLPVTFDTCEGTAGPIGCGRTPSSRSKRKGRTYTGRRRSTPISRPQKWRRGVQCAPNQIDDCKLLKTIQ
jgi:hypothetical protein